MPVVKTTELRLIGVYFRNSKSYKPLVFFFNAMHRLAWTFPCCTARIRPTAGMAHGAASPNETCNEHLTIKSNEIRIKIYSYLNDWFQSTSTFEIQNGNHCFTLNFDRKHFTLLESTCWHFSFFFISLIFLFANLQALNWRLLKQLYF